jgi:hypothetical protein
VGEPIALEKDSVHPRRSFGQADFLGKGGEGKNPFSFIPFTPAGEGKILMKMGAAKSQV